MAKRLPRHFELRWCLLCSALILFVANFAHAFENKVDLSVGFFSLVGENKATGQRPTASGVGAYRLGYRRNVSHFVDIGVGYTLAFSKLVTGDSLFGLDVQARYFPLSAAGAIRSEYDGSTLIISEQFRPYLGGSFIQRNFKGVQTTYVGFGFSGGAEYRLDSKMSLLGEFRFASLSASSANTATEMVVSTGVSFGF